MRHWLWYRADGSLGGEAIYPCGFDVTVDLNDDSEEALEVVKSFRSNLATQPGFAGFVPFQCGCDPSEVYCDCARMQHVHYYRDGSGVLVPKPIFEVLVDDVVMPFTVGAGGAPNTLTTIDRVPGSSSFLKLRQHAGSPEAIPDNTSYFVHSRNAETIQTNPTELQFSGGETPTLELIAPSQGLVALIGVRPAEDRRGHPQSFRMRGWGA